MKQKLIFILIVLGTLFFGFMCSRWARSGPTNFSVGNLKQIQWQRQHKVKSLGLYKLTTEGYWLSEDPNKMCCDLNFDGYIDFFDYAVFLNNYLASNRRGERETSHLN